jgi:DNA-binding GntR family transcriptional regulator
VRQALRRLEWESLVVILPRRGTLVADLNDSDLGRIYELRSVLEPQAAELAAERGTAEQRAALAGVIAAMHAELARPTPDRRVLIGLDRDLHRQIWAMAGNEMLEQTLEWLFSHVLRRWNVSIDRNESLGSVMQMHDEIADAIVAGDAQQARAAMTRHVAGFQASQTS